MWKFYQNCTFSNKWQPCFFVLYTPFQARERFGQCRTIFGPEYQCTLVIVYSCFCLLYKCFSLMRRTWLCRHHCFKFSGSDRLRNRDGCVGTCCWTLVTVKLCWFWYWQTGIIISTEKALNRAQEKKDKQQLSHQFYLTVLTPFTPKSAKSNLRRNLWISMRRINKNKQ